MEVKIWIFVICSLVALSHCAPTEDDNAERAKRPTGCSSPKAQPGTVYYKDCTKFECKKKRRTFVWDQTLSSEVCCIVENKGFPVGSVIFSNSTTDNCTISTLTCRNNGHLPNLFYQYQSNQCKNEKLFEAHANSTEDGLERMETKLDNLEEHANLTEEALGTMKIEMRIIKTMLDILLNKTAIESQGPSAVTTNTTTSTTTSTTNTTTTTTPTTTTTTTTPAGDLLYTGAGYQYYRVAVPAGTRLAEGSVPQTCENVGLQAVCSGPSDCRFSSSRCVVTPLSTLCYQPMYPLSKLLCNGNMPTQCPEVEGVFSYMKNHGGSECGSVGNIWCAAGANYVSGNPKTYFAYCAKAV